MRRDRILFRRIYDEKSRRYFIKTFNLTLIIRTKEIMICYFNYTKEEY